MQRTPSPVIEESFELIDKTEIGQLVDDQQATNPDVSDHMERAPTPVDLSPPRLARDPSRAESLARISPRSKKRIVQVGFVVDCTASMGPYIEATKETIIKTAQRLYEMNNTTVEFAGVMYRDIPPQDKTYVTRKFEFDPDVQAFVSFIQEQSAQGGGDGPEAVASALHEAVQLKWKTSNTQDEENTTHITRTLIFVTDAPPHGIGIYGDAFPQGEPVWNQEQHQTESYDPVTEMYNLCALNITSHFVFAEQGNYGSCPITRSFYRNLASLSQGRAVRLGDAKDLVELVSSSAIEACEMDDLAEELSKMMDNLKKKHPEMSDDEMRSTMYRSLRSKEHVTQIACSELDDSTCMHFRSCSSIEEMRKMSDTIKPSYSTYSTHRLTPTHEHPHDDGDEEEGYDSSFASCSPPMYRSISAFESSKPFQPKYRSFGSTAVTTPSSHNKRLASDSYTTFKVSEVRAPPPSPAMRVRSYNGQLTENQINRIMSRIMT